VDHYVKARVLQAIGDDGFNLFLSFLEREGIRSNPATSFATFIDNNPNDFLITLRSFSKMYLPRDVLCKIQACIDLTSEQFTTISSMRENNPMGFYELDLALKKGQSDGRTIAMFLIKGQYQTDKPFQLGIQQMFFTDLAQHSPEYAIEKVKRNIH